MSNFSFLQNQWPLLHESAVLAKSLAATDPRATCFYARRTLELALAWLYKHERALRLPYQDNLAALIHEPSFRQVAGDAVFTKAKVIKELGHPTATDGSTSEALRTRLFKAAEPPAAYGAVPNDQQLRDGTAAHLRDIVAAMNTDNFVVRPQRKSVEKFGKPEAWQWLSQDDQAELATRVARLPTELVDNDEEAKRFDMLVLRTQLAILRSTPGFDGLRDQIRAIAHALEEQESVPAIKAEMVLIQAIAGDEWWADVTLGMLENARKRLRALVKLVEKSKRKIVYTDFVDEMGAVSTVALPEVASGLDMARFKDKARQFLRAHEGHLALQRLRRGQPLTAVDLQELARMLIDAGGSPALIQRAVGDKLSLGLFIRSLVGMEREAVSQAFSDLVAGTSATADQIEFIGLVVEELTANGTMEARRLYESPFLDISPQGPEMLFSAEKVETLVRTLEDMRQRAWG